MPFLTFNNANIKLTWKKLIWRSYIAAEPLPTTKQVEIIDRKEFAKIALDEHIEAFVVHITSLLTMAIHPAWKAQIALLIAKKVQIPSKYSDFSDVFLEKKVLVLLVVTDLYQHAIKLQKSQQQPYGLIHSLGSVKLEKLKTCIKINLANSFFWPLKSLTSVPILFVGKLDSSLRLCIDYWGLNHLTIKNRYLLPLISKSLDQLGRAKRFTSWTSSVPIIK